MPELAAQLHAASRSREDADGNRRAVRQDRRDPGQARLHRRRQRPVDGGRAAVAARHRGRSRPGRGSDPRLRLRQHPDDVPAAPVGHVQAGAQPAAASRAAGPPGARRARHERGRDLVVPGARQGRAVRREPAGGPASPELDRRHARHHAALDPAQPDRRGAAQRGARVERSGAVRGRPRVQERDADGPENRRRRPAQQHGRAAQLDRNRRAPSTPSTPRPMRSPCWPRSARRWTTCRPSRARPTGTIPAARASSSSATA